MSAQVAAPADLQNRQPRMAGRGPGPAPPLRPPIVVDREKHGRHRDLEEYATRGQEPADEVQIYTWKDATLRELTDLLKEVAPEARRRDARLSFAFVYPNRQGRNVMKQVGTTFSSSRRETVDDRKTLQELGFQTGDFLDVAIFS